MTKTINRHSPWLHGDSRPVPRKHVSAPSILVGRPPVRQKEIMLNKFLGWQFFKNYAHWLLLPLLPVFEPLFPPAPGFSLLLWLPQAQLEVCDNKDTNDWLCWLTQLFHENIFTAVVCGRFHTIQSSSKKHSNVPSSTVSYRSVLKIIVCITTYDFMNVSPSRDVFLSTNELLPLKGARNQSRFTILPSNMFDTATSAPPP